MPEAYSRCSRASFSSGQDSPPQQIKRKTAGNEMRWPVLNARPWAMKGSRSGKRGSTERPWRAGGSKPGGASGPLSAPSLRHRQELSTQSGWRRLPLPRRAAPPPAPSTQFTESGRGRRRERGAHPAPRGNHVLVPPARRVTAPPPPPPPAAPALAASPRPPGTPGPGSGCRCGWPGSSRTSGWWSSRRSSPAGRGGGGRAGGWRVGVCTPARAHGGARYLCAAAAAAAERSAVRLDEASPSEAG